MHQRLLLAITALLFTTGCAVAQIDSCDWSLCDEFTTSLQPIDSDSDALWDNGFPGDGVCGRLEHPLLISPVFKSPTTLLSLTSSLLSSLGHLSISSSSFVNRDASSNQTAVVCLLLEHDDSLAGTVLQNVTISGEFISVYLVKEPSDGGSTLRLTPVLQVVNGARFELRLNNSDVVSVGQVEVHNSSNFNAIVQDSQLLVHGVQASDAVVHWQILHGADLRFTTGVQMDGDGELGFFVSADSSFGSNVTVAGALASRRAPIVFQGPGQVTLKAHTISGPRLDMRVNSFGWEPLSQLQILQLAQPDTPFAPCVGDVSVRGIVSIAQSVSVEPKCQLTLRVLRHSHLELGSTLEASENDNDSLLNITVDSLSFLDLKRLQTVRGQVWLVGGFNAIVVFDYRPQVLPYRFHAIVAAPRMRFDFSPSLRSRGVRRALVIETALDVQGTVALYPANDVYFWPVTKHNKSIVFCNNHFADCDDCLQLPSDNCKSCLPQFFDWCLENGTCFPQCNGGNSDDDDDDDDDDSNTSDAPSTALSLSAQALRLALSFASVMCALAVLL